MVMERTNARYLTPEDFEDLIDFAVIDASFISLKLLIPPLLPLFRKKISILALIKPQFEVGRGKVGKGGIVRDPELHQAVIAEIVVFCKTLGLQSLGVVPSPILGPKGNKEFLIHLACDALWIDREGAADSPTGNKNVQLAVIIEIRPYHGMPVLQQ